MDTRNGAAADAAAALARHGRPPPLPLPPNLQVADLPKQLRPTKGRAPGPVRPVEPAPCAGPGGEKTLAAPHGDAAAIATASPLESQPTVAGQTDDAPDVAKARWLSDPTDVWKDRPLSELAEVASNILSDVSTLGADCDRLFSQICQEVSGKNYLDVEKLHEITQLLLGRFHVSSSCTLDRVANVYSAVTGGRGDTGLSQLEFRGYIAAVLTQILQDLDARIEGRLPEDVPETADAENSDGSGLIESLQGWITKLTSALD